MLQKKNNLIIKLLVVELKISTVNYYAHHIRCDNNYYKWRRKQKQTNKKQWKQGKNKRNYSDINQKEEIL